MASFRNPMEFSVDPPKSSTSVHSTSSLKELLLPIIPTNYRPLLNDLSVIGKSQTKITIAADKALVKLINKYRDLHDWASPKEIEWIESESIFELVESENKHHEVQISKLEDTIPNQIYIPTEFSTLYKHTLKLISQTKIKCSPNDVFNVIQEITGITFEECKKTKIGEDQIVHARNSAIFIMNKALRMNKNEIAEYLHRNHSTIVQIVKSVNAKITRGDFIYCIILIAAYGQLQLAKEANNDQNTQNIRCDKYCDQ